MRRIVLCMLICAAGLLNAAAAAAETAYITDTIRLSVRSGPANDQKSLGLVESGQTVDILKSSDEWSLVRTATGIEGHVLSRDLTSQPPAKSRFDQVQEKNKTLTAQAAGLLEETNRLKADNEKLAAAAASEFCRFHLETGARQILLTHLNELGRDANDYWGVPHAELVRRKILAICDNIPVSHLVMGDCVLFQE